MDNTVQAEEQYIDQYAQDMVNTAASGDAAAAAWAAYYTSLGSDWAAQATGDVSAWQTDVQQVATAAQNQTQADASAAQGLVDQVVSAEVGLVSQLASAADSTAKQLEAAAVTAIDGWSVDAKTDALSDINAAVPVCRQLDQDALNCEEGCISAGLTEADNQWSQWLGTVEVDDGDADQCGNTVAGNLDKGQHTVDQAAQTGATGLAQQGYNLAVNLANAHQTWYNNNIQWQMSTTVQIAQANASRVNSTPPPLNGTSAVALMESSGVCGWASVLPFLNSEGLCLAPYMSGSTLLTAAESAKGVTFAGHYWGPGQYQPPVQHTSGGGGGGGSSSSEPSVLGSFGLGLGQGALNIVNGLQDMAIGLANAPAAAWNGIGWLEGKAGILNPNDPVYAPYIPSPDWSRGAITQEGGQGWGDTHNWSKFAGATGVTAAFAAWARAAQAAEAAKALANCFPPDTLVASEAGLQRIADVRVGIPGTQYLIVGRIYAILPQFVLCPGNCPQTSETWPQAKTRELSIVSPEFTGI